MGLNICVYDADTGKEAPEWDWYRYAGDRDIARLISTLPHVSRNGVRDDLKMPDFEPHYRPSDFAAWRAASPGEDNIVKHLGGGTYLGAAVSQMNDLKKLDRLIVITDEQSHDSVPQPTMPHAYMINVASAQRGVGYGRWTHIDGFSESVLRFIQEYEGNDR